MTLPLLKVAELGEENETLANAQFNFDQIAKLFLDTGGRAVKMRFGTTTVSPSAEVSKTTTVTHGMGSTPLAVLATHNGGQTTAVVTAGTPGATTFTVTLRDSRETALTGTFTIAWLALG